jgi:hypothetical protein
MLTPEQTQDLIDWAGGERVAAQEIGVHRKMLWRWKNPEASRAEIRRQVGVLRGRRREAGLCRVCADPATSAVYCGRCLARHNARTAFEKTFSVATY